MTTQYYNPYSGENFFGFFYQLAIRLWTFVKGDLPFESLVSDEIQILVLIGVAASTAQQGHLHMNNHAVFLGIEVDIEGKRPVDESNHAPFQDGVRLLFADYFEGIVVDQIDNDIFGNGDIQSRLRCFVAEKRNINAFDIFRSAGSSAVITATDKCHNTHEGDFTR